jgi:hypothetical protein
MTTDSALIRDPSNSEPVIVRLCGDAVWVFDKTPPTPKVFQGEYHNFVDGKEYIKSTRTAERVRSNMRSSVSGSKEATALRANAGHTKTAPSIPFVPKKARTHP